MIYSTAVISSALDACWRSRHLPQNERNCNSIVKLNTARNYWNIGCRWLICHIKVLVAPMQHLATFSTVTVTQSGDSDPLQLLLHSCEN